MLYLTQPIPDPESGAALIDRTDLDECWAMKPEPRPVNPQPIPQMVPVPDWMQSDIRAERIERGLTLAELAAMVGLSQSGLHRIETGTRVSTHRATYAKLRAFLSTEGMAA